MRRLLVLLALLGLALSIVGPGRPRAELLDALTLKVSAGVVATSSNVDSLKVDETFSTSVLKKVSSRVCVQVAYQDLNVDTLNLENFTGGVLVFGRELKEEEGSLVFDRPTLFARLNIDFTHNSRDNKDVAKGFDGGLGVVFPFMGSNAVIQVDGKRLLGSTTIWSLTVGSLFNLGS